MKANTPSLIFYFLACALTILFNLTGQESLAVYSKAIVVPSIFIYYLVTNNYKIDLTRLEFFCFVLSVKFIF